MPAEDGAVLIRALRHPDNYKPIVFCSISLIAAGIVMVVIGVIIILVDHIELGPPHYDDQFARYQGSSFAHIAGKFC